MSVYKYSLKVLGITLLVTGLILNLAMIRFGWWPNFLFLILMISGAVAFYFYRREPMGSYSLPFELQEFLSVFRRHFRKLIRVAVYVFAGIVILYGAGAYFGIKYHQKENTIKECEEIALALNKYYSEKGQYPSSLQAIVAGNPLRTAWLEDSWGSVYEYVVSGGGRSFKLKSAGKDKVFNTNDDLIF